MLAKRFRLPIQNFVGKRGRSVKTPYFLLKIFSNFGAKADSSRFGVVISGKVSKKAVERNRIKRVILDFFRHNREKFALADYLLIIHPSVNNLDKKHLLAELGKLLVIKNP